MPWEYRGAGSAERTLAMRREYGYSSTGWWKSCKGLMADGRWPYRRARVHVEVPDPRVDRLVDNAQLS